MGVEVGVVVPRDRQLLRQAAQRARAVDPELAAAVRVQGLQGWLVGWFRSHPLDPVQSPDKS